MINNKFINNSKSLEWKKRLIKYLKNHFYLILSLFCFYLWPFYLIIQVLFFSYSDPDLFHDFKVFYSAGNYILKDPSLLYTYFFRSFFYSPNTALFFGIFFSWYPLNYAIMIMIIFLMICGLLMIIEYNKILGLLGVKNRLFRLVFIIVAYNGWFVYEEFFGLNIRIFTGLLLLLVLRREMDPNIEKNNTFYLINYGLMIFLIGFAPYFLFLLLIYIFYNIKIKDLIEKKNLIKYLMVISLFLGLNFLFLIYPSLFFKFLNHANIYRNYFVFLYGWFYSRWFFLYFSADFISVYSTIMTFLILIYSIFLTIIGKLKINQRMSYFLLGYLFLGTYSFHFMVTFQLIILLFIPYLKTEYVGIKIIKKNFIIFFGLFSILILNIIRKRFDMLNFWNLARNIVLISISIICLIILSISSKRGLNLNLNKVPKSL